MICTLAELVVDAPRAVLDVGTGTGELARRLVGSVDCVDAVDVTARQSVAALTRSTRATADYHFIRPHRSLRCRGRPCTPAVMAMNASGGYAAR